jgi:hypothetical protein
MMMVKDMDCKECGNYYSCQIMVHRFGEKECNIGHEIIVNNKHNEEVQKRSELLERLGITWS